MKYKFGIRDHRGSLEESLLTTIYIGGDDFRKLLPRYKYYSFDERVNSFMFVLRDIEKYYRDYKIWLFIEIII